MDASIIIPSYNSMERLYYNLLSLNNQDYPFDQFEVIVINNGSTDLTSEMLNKFKSHFSLKVVTIPKNKGIAHGRNQGILKAKGNILIFHDSDMIATKDYVRKHIESHTKDNMVVCGMFWKRIYSYYYKYFDANQQQKLQNIWKISRPLKDKTALVSVKDIQNERFLKYTFDLDNLIVKSLKEKLSKYGEELTGYVFPWRFFLTNNSSVARKKVIEVGMFDEKNQNWGFEDIDLAYRLYQANCQFKIKQDIVNIHQEHPLKYSLPQYSKSLQYMFNKYNKMEHLDMLLILLTITTSTIPPVKTLLDENKLDILYIEWKEMLSNKEQHPYIDLLKELLQVLQNTHRGEGNKKKVELLKLYLSTLSKQKEKLLQELEKPTYLHTLFTLKAEL